jgi:hypothetical protein
MSQVFDTTDPVFPRESAFFDVKLPTSTLAIDADDYLSYVPPCPLLQVELLHSDDDTASGKGGKKGSQKSSQKSAQKSGDPDAGTITPLGTIKINALDLITGRSPPADTWVDLPGGQGQLRVTCEYECADEPPGPGDLVRLNGFCSPNDLRPVPIGRLFEVDDVEGDGVVLKYKTEVSPPASEASAKRASDSGAPHSFCASGAGRSSGRAPGLLPYPFLPNSPPLRARDSQEDWDCTFRVHRFCCISAVRHQRALEQ